MPDLRTSTFAGDLLRLLGMCLCLFSTQLLVGCSSLACKQLDADGCDVLAEFAVFGPEEPLHFNHHCSDPENNYGASRTAYVYFRSEQDGFEMRALAELALGWVYGPRGGQGVQIHPHRMKVTGLGEWAEEHFLLKLALRQVNGGKPVVGESIVGYVGRLGSEQLQRRRFELSSRGNLDWEQFREPDAETAPDSDRLYGYPDDASRIRVEALPDLAQAYRLLLIAQNADTGEEIVLNGPVVDGLPAHLDLVKPQWKTLGFWQTMNPAQEGGLWHWLGTAAEYGECVYARRAAKKMFDERAA